MNHKPGHRAPTQRNITVVGQVREFLEGHFADVPSLPELAAMAGMSRSHFSRTFHAVVGTPLRQYVADLRLQRACVLLKTSALSLTAIAMECGFYDLPHFDKAFRRRFGMPPQRFRHHDGGASGSPARLPVDGLQQRTASNTARARALVRWSVGLIAQSQELERRHRRFFLRGSSEPDHERSLRAARTRMRVRSGDVAVPFYAGAVRGEPSRGRRCSGCADDIVPGAIEYAIQAPTATLAFHRECWRAWMAARSSWRAQPEYRAIA
ncbi:MAG TPA: AraC family transcriptional regulator [Methylomirabilota bacterium]|jgi:AraC-like DNA-binding protein|nr:AraC family transcriptional regulator [Methylomirabilota bacterium]